MSYPEEDFRHYRTWAEGNGRSYAVPTPASSLRDYLQDLAEQNKTYSTIEKRFFGVSAYNVKYAEVEGAPKLSEDPEIRTWLGTFNGERGRFGRERKDALLPEGVRALLRAMREPPMALAAYRNVAIVTLQRSAGLKPFAIAELDRRHVHFRQDVMEVYVRRAGRAAAWMKLAPEPDDELCPKRAMHEYLKELGPVPGGSPLFRMARRGDHLTTNKLTAHSITRAIKLAADAAGIDYASVSAQSIRLGRIAEVVTKAGPNHKEIARVVGFSDTLHLGLWGSMEP